jgi:uncharacterized protein (TIGR02453 family)
MSGFPGFSPQCVQFWSDLTRNNNKAWFEEHKPDYDKYVLDPSREFVIALGERLRVLVPDIHAEPKVNKSLFRIYRDIRFSKDKTPYKTHMAIWFWEGNARRMQCSGFYFQIEPPELLLGTGIYCFPKPLLDQYRDSVADPKLGAALTKAMKTVASKGDYTLGLQHYKRVPRGYDKDSPRADLLLYNGLFMRIVMPIPQEFFEPGIVDFCLKHFANMLPLHQWLNELVQRTAQAA